MPRSNTLSTLNYFLEMKIVRQFNHRSVTLSIIRKLFVLIDAMLELVRTKPNSQQGKNIGYNDSMNIIFSI